MSHADDSTTDAFHRGRFHVLQPRGRGHRSGMDAMLLASLVVSDGPFRLADLGAGAGAAGMAVASRLPDAEVWLFERSPEMAYFARKSLELAHNDGFSGRIHVMEADVALRGQARLDSGLTDNTFHHVIMNPPFNDASDRRTPDELKADAHAMTDGLFNDWIRTACAIAVPGGQLSLIARPESIGDIIAACTRRFGGIEITPVHPRAGANAVRLLVTAIKGSRARLSFRSPLVMHEGEGHAFASQVDDLSNGRTAWPRIGNTRKSR